MKPSESTLLDALKALQVNGANPVPKKAAGKKAAAKKADIGVNKSTGTSQSDRQSDTQSNWLASGKLPLQDLSVAVQGFGPLPSPLDAQTAQRLHAATHPAQHGKRDKTLLDTRVRDTGEIPAQAVALSWHADASQEFADSVAQALGLPQVELRLHNLLLYGPGQFFKPHQDTEKYPRMVATVVLCWPSAHIGGELKLVHDGEVRRWASQHLQASALQWAAFYADCRHEVLPVTEGWRLILSFDVVLVQTRTLDASLSTAPPDAAPAALTAALQQHFGGQPESAAQAPWVYLLEHEYTEHGVRWALLKGEDRARASALRAAAMACGLQVDLALAEIHQTWSASYGSRSGRGSGRGTPRGRARQPDPEPEDLIDEELSLNYWVDAADRPHSAGALSVQRDSLFSLSETDEAFLVDSEYEGYMGNWGETLDYWYRRAAVVIRAPHAAQVQRFETEFDAALRDALAMARQPDRVEALASLLRAALRRLQARWASRSGKLPVPYAELAAALPQHEDELALALFNGMVPAELAAKDVAVLATLEKRRGSPWMLAWLQVLGEKAFAAWGWHARPSGTDTQSHAAMTEPASTEAAKSANFAEGAEGASAAKSESAKPIDPNWPLPQQLDLLMRDGARAGLSFATLAAVLDLAHTRLLAADDKLRTASPAQRQSSWPHRLTALCEMARACQAFEAAQAAANEAPAQAADRLGQLLEHVQMHPARYPLKWLRPLIETLAAVPGSAAQGQPLRRAVQAALQAALAPPDPGPQHQGLVEIEWTCACQDCTQLASWAAAATAQPLVLAVAEARRSHVADRVQDAAAPLQLQVLKRGSPHQLVISKPADVPQRRQALRARWQADLLALQAL